MESKFETIKKIILRNMPEEGIVSSSVRGIRFVRRDNPSDFLRCFYNTACMFVLEGKKQVLWGDNSIVYKKGQYVVSCTDIPVSSRIIEATVENPFLVVLLEFDSNIISDLIIETKIEKAVENDEKCLAIADIDSDLLDVFYRLVQLIEKPKTEQDILAPIVIKEIYYRLLTGPLGNQLRIINTKGTSSNQIAQAIALLKNKFREKLDIEDIAHTVNMAPSSFYRNFRKITQVSPLQYQKQLRLYEAQRLMLTGEHNAESASYMVGYESPTQFSREYKKMFGAPPKTDVKKMINV